MVCTEVVYRSYQGIGEIEFELSLRAGRQTLSAEDLLNMALNKKGFEVLGTFGIGGNDKEIVTGEKAIDELKQSMNLSPE